MSGNWIFLTFVSAAIVFVCFMVYLVFRSQKNGIECWQLIATKNKDNEERADLNKIGQLVALIVFTGIVIYYVSISPLGMEIMALITLYVGYAGWISGFPAYLRSKQGAPAPQPVAP